MKWRKFTREDQLAWTQVFIDYPPVFLGFAGMSKALQDWRDGKPTKRPEWIREAEGCAAIGFSPLLYAYVRETLRHEDRPERRLDPERWSNYVEGVSNGLPYWRGAMGVYSRGPEFIDRQLKDIAEGKLRREITRRVERELRQELARLDNLEA